ncbi:MAG: IS1 family transposase [Desulfamplus sp.]|nr:IS1 family transposase [Desulfamplus sp.]
MNCPECDSSRTIKNGSRKNGKQNYRCLSCTCSRQFVDNPSPHYHISEETKTLIDRLLLEKIHLAGIAPYDKIFPQKRHKAVGKESAHTKHS